jgi:hypothetical protein
MAHQVQLLRLVAMMSCVAAIWPRSEASCTAATTTLDVA